MMVKNPTALVLADIIQFQHGSKDVDAAAVELRRLYVQNESLLKSIRKTIEENGHLADGDDCTLIYLVLAIDAARRPND